MSEKNDQETIDELTELLSKTTELVNELKKCLIGDRGLKHIVPFSNQDFWGRSLEFIEKAEQTQKDGMYQKYNDMVVMIRLMDKYLVNRDYDLAIKNEIFFEKRKEELK